MFFFFVLFLSSQFSLCNGNWGLGIIIFHSLRFTVYNVIVLFSGVERGFSSITLRE